MKSIFRVITRSFGDFEYTPLVEWVKSRLDSKYNYMDRDSDISVFHYRNCLLHVHVYSAIIFPDVDDIFDEIDKINASKKPIVYVSSNMWVKHKLRNTTTAKEIVIDVDEKLLNMHGRSVVRDKNIKIYLKE